MSTDDNMAAVSPLVLDWRVDDSTRESSAALLSLVSRGRDPHSPDAAAAEEVGHHTKCKSQQPEVQKYKKKQTLLWLSKYVTSTS